MNNQKRVDKIIRDIKSIKIQGARNIAKAALSVYSKNPSKSVKDKLMKARPTEPMLVHTLRIFDKLGKQQTLEHFSLAQQKINTFIFKLIKNNSIIFTHCHSTNVINALIYAKKHRKKFQVYNTETRPLFQGRQTSQELKKAGIPVTQFVDSAARVALRREQGTRKTDFVFLGADAVVNQGAINKIGSGMFAEIAYDNNIPVYIIADSWKHSPENLKIEQREFNEVWNNSKIKIKNPSFELIQKKYIKAIVSEFGILSFSKFMKKSS